jgi:hypothetical protein
VLCAQSKEKKKEEQKNVNASCEETMEGMMHWQKAKTNS